MRYTEDSLVQQTTAEWQAGYMSDIIIIKTEDKPIAYCLEEN